MSSSLSSFLNNVLCNTIIANMTLNVYSRINSDTLKNSHIKSPFAILKELETEMEDE